MFVNIRCLCLTGWQCSIWCPIRRLHGFRCASYHCLWRHLPLPCQWKESQRKGALCSTAIYLQNMSGNEEYIKFSVLNQVKHRKARHHSMDTKTETGCASISAFCTVCRKDFAASLGTDANLNYKPSRTQNISWWLAPFLVQVVVAVFPTFSAAFLIGNKGLSTVTALSESECQNTTTTVSGLDKMLE